MMKYNKQKNQKHKPFLLEFNFLNWNRKHNLNVLANSTFNFQTYKNIKIIHKVKTFFE